MSVLAAASILYQIGTGTPLWVGEASLEGEVQDAGTGEVLNQFVDRRVGGKELIGAFDSEDDVKHALDTWAKESAAWIRAKQGGG